jgi:putative addiction module component (TIGR02574 family)
MNVVLPLNEMTVAEKLRVMEILWDDLSRNPNDIPLPSWHADVLADRQRQIEEGRAKFVPWDEFRQRIQEETQ